MNSWQLEVRVWSTKNGKTGHWQSDSSMRFYQEASVPESPHWNSWSEPARSNIYIYIAIKAQHNTEIAIYQSLSSHVTSLNGVLLELNGRPGDYQLEERWCLDLNNVIRLSTWNIRKCSINTLTRWQHKGSINSEAAALTEQNLCKTKMLESSKEIPAFIWLLLYQKLSSKHKNC